MNVFSQSASQFMHSDSYKFVSGAGSDIQEL